MEIKGGGVRIVYGGGGGDLREWGMMEIGENWGRDKGIGGRRGWWMGDER